MPDEITIIQLNHRRQEVWRYKGHIVCQRPGTILLEAVFSKPDLKLQYATIRTGDIFRELYYSHHWYNIYQIHDKRNRQIIFWYCNIARPAQITVHKVIFVDLALDLVVFLDERSIDLDWDEFVTLGLSRTARNQAMSG